ncbi:MAG: PIN domain-containing protein [Chloroflexaceae bacterium]|jgi:predicted nucleic acid-binding protein|nr:PIN domain-containing protein [Chloroflexaceae bacterium]
MFTIDASFFLRLLSPTDPGFVTCNDLLDVLRTRAIPIFQPFLVLAEVAGAASRTFHDPIRGRLATDVIIALPGVSFIALDAALTDEATTIAADYFLRGADATYAAVARRYGCTLISLDEEHQQRLQSILTVQTPVDAPAALTTP